MLNKDFDYITYLKTLQSEGLNYTRTLTGKGKIRELKFPEFVQMLALKLTSN